MTSAVHLESRDQHPVSTELPIDLFSAQAVDLSHDNTMALACVADAVVTLTDEAQLDSFMTSYINNSEHKPSLFVLSGGSNVLLPAQLNAVVLQPQMRGIHLTTQTDDYVDIEVMAGENWHDLVVHTVEQGWYGLENLALICWSNGCCTSTKHRRLRCPTRGLFTIRPSLSFTNSNVASSIANRLPVWLSR